MLSRGIVGLTHTRLEADVTSGATAAPQAVVNAVVDALAHLGVRDVEMPCTPQKVWRILQAATANGS